MKTLLNILIGIIVGFILGCVLIYSTFILNFKITSIVINGENVGNANVTAETFKTKINYYYESK